MEITAARVKELRERTGSGMMECKKALIDAHGDIDAAAELLRKSGAAKADKKAGRIAAEGSIATAISQDGKQAVMVEVNCETDFVAKDANFTRFAEAVAARALEHAPADLETLMGLPLQAGGSTTLNTARQELVAKIGENVNVRRFVRFQTAHRLGVYLHGHRIGVLVELRGGDDALAKDIAMHVAASKPQYLNGMDVPAEVLAKEREILAAQSAGSGKPPEIIAKMVDGRIKKFLAEITLLGQPFVKDPERTVEKLLKQGGAEVLRFQRFEVGEGIEKKSVDFAAEVMAQVRGN